MRSLVLFIIGGALLATGCKSEDPAAAKTGDPEAAGAQSGQPDNPTPALPVPRRMRSSQTGSAPADPAARRAWREQRGEEMRQRIAEMRQHFDANGDGQLDERERGAMRDARIKDRVARLDADSDGMISRQEAEAAPLGGRMLRDFDAVDANQDSRISPEELAAAMSERQARRRERQREPDGEEAGGTPETSPAD